MKNRYNSKELRKSLCPTLFTYSISHAVILHGNDNSFYCMDVDLCKNLRLQSSTDLGKSVYKSS